MRESQISRFLSAYLPVTNKKKHLNHSFTTFYNMPSYFDSFPGKRGMTGLSFNYTRISRVRGGGKLLQNTGPGGGCRYLNLALTISLPLPVLAQKRQNKPEIRCPDKKSTLFTWKSVLADLRGFQCRFGANFCTLHKRILLVSDLDAFIRKQFLNTDLLFLFETRSRKIHAACSVLLYLYVHFQWWSVWISAIRISVYLITGRGMPA